MFSGLGLQGHTDVYPLSNIFECSFTEEGTGAGKAIFEGGFKFAASETRKKFDSVNSEDRGAIGEKRGDFF